jgi:hypothetical protein
MPAMIISTDLETVRDPFLCRPTFIAIKARLVERWIKVCNQSIARIDMKGFLLAG